MIERRTLKRVYDLQEIGNLLGVPRGYRITDLTQYNDNGEKVGVTYTSEMKEVEDEK